MLAWYARMQHGGPGHIPQFNQFSGEVPPAKSEVLYDQCMYKVQSVQKNYWEAVLREVITRFLRGNAADTMRFLGTQASVSEILSKLTTMPYMIVSFYVLIQPSYQLQQEKGKCVSPFLIRIEEAISDIQNKYPNQMSEGEASQLLYQHLYYGLRQSLCDSLWVLFMNKNNDITTLLGAAHNIENEHDVNKGSHHVAMKRAGSDGNSESTSSDLASDPQPLLWGHGEGHGLGEPNKFLVCWVQCHECQV